MDFKVIPKHDQLVEAMKKIKTFIKPIVSSSLTGTHNRSNSSCHNIQLTKIPHSQDFNYKQNIQMEKNFNGNLTILK